MLSGDELADQAEAILAEWEKNGRGIGTLFSDDGSACLVGAWSRVNDIRHSWWDSTADPYSLFDESGFYSALKVNLKTNYVIHFNDSNDDETVFDALKQFAKYHRSDEYRSC